MQYTEMAVTTLKVKNNRLYIPLWVQRITGVKDGTYTVYQTEKDGVVILKRKDDR